MSVKSCEKIEKSQVVLTIEVGAPEFEAAIEKAYQKMRKKINVPGFRPGKAPRKIIEGIAKDIEVGDVFTGKVVRIMNFGAFVELLPGKDGMIHISKLANHRVEKVEDVVKIGDTLEVKVAEIDAQGRVNLVRNDITYDNTAAAAPRRAEGFRARPPRRDGRN